MTELDWFKILSASVFTFLMGMSLPIINNTTKLREYKKNMKTYEDDTLNDLLRKNYKILAVVLGCCAISLGLTIHSYL